MNKIDLLHYLQKNVDRLKYLLERFGFNEFHIDAKGYLRCELPDGANNQSVAIDITTECDKPLYSRIYSRGYEGDFYDLIQYVKKYKFSKVLRKCHEYLGLEYEGYAKALKNKPILKYSVELKEDRIGKVSDNSHRRQHDKDNEEYDLKILDQYTRLPHFSLFEEAIIPQTQEKYGIRYSLEDQRIIIPHFKYNDKTKIVGIQGRTTVKSYEKSSVPKYTNLIEGFRKSKNLYGLSHNIKDIKGRRQLVIFEGEKSVMKLDTMTRHKSFGVALGGSNLSDFQANLIGRISKQLKEFEVIVALDKDVSKEVVLDMCNKLHRNGCDRVSYITDDLDLLDEKDSPVDKGVKKFFELFENRISV